MNKGEWCQQIQKYSYCLFFMLSIWWLSMSTNWWSNRHLAISCSLYCLLNNSACLWTDDLTPEGRPRISGLSFDSTLLSPLLFFCLVLLLFKIGSKNGIKLFWYLISFMKFYQNFQKNCYPFVIQGKKTLFSIDYILVILIWHIPLFGEKKKLLFVLHVLL